MRCIHIGLLATLAVSLGAGCEQKPQEAVARPSLPAAASPSETPLTEGTLRHAVATSQKPQLGEFTALQKPSREPRDLELVSDTVEAGPTIDGRADDAAWNSATEITTLDRSSQREIRLKSVHTAGEIFILATYPDAAPSESHKTWVWDAGEEIYKQGVDREDALVLKWSRSGDEANLSIFNDPTPHEADIWFWKACRTNPAGYADDKQQRVTATPVKDARPIDGPNGQTLFLKRSGDAGRSAYLEDMVFEYQSDTVPRFTARQPEGSRGDVRAKGRWSNGAWTIEFARKLDTGSNDDMAFEIGRSHLFGVSCYEMSFDEPVPEWTQPLYRTGDVFDRILLTVR